MEEELTLQEEMELEFQNRKKRIPDPTRQEIRTRARECRRKWGLPDYRDVEPGKYKATPKEYSVPLDALPELWNFLLEAERYSNEQTLSYGLKPGFNTRRLLTDYRS
jgi:hypothetical protein